MRRSEKVYILSNSTADFRNAFLKTIRQIIRESVRNMSIPANKLGTGSSILLHSHKGMILIKVIPTLPSYRKFTTH